MTRCRKMWGLFMSMIFPATIFFVFNNSSHGDGLWMAMIIPSLVCVAGYLTINDEKPRDQPKKKSLVEDMTFLLLSLFETMTLSVALIDMDTLPMMIIGCEFVMWTAILEIVFDLTTPIIGVAVANVVTVTLSERGGHNKALICIPIALGAVMICVSRQFKSRPFCKTIDEDAKASQENTVKGLSNES